MDDITYRERLIIGLLQGNPQGPSPSPTQDEVDAVAKKYNITPVHRTATNGRWNDE